LGYTYFYTPDVYAVAKSVFVTKDKKILLTGLYSKSAAEQVAAVQCNNNGTIDSAFGENGVAAGGFAENIYGPDITSGVGLLQPDGKIIVSGSFLQNGGDTYNVALFRFNGDESRQQTPIARIKRWLHKHGITWDDCPPSICNNITGYAVQRSTNGINWNTVFSSRRSANSQRSSTNMYEDPSPLPGTNYYRLQTTSVSGLVANSNVIAIDNESSSISLSPNPAKNVLQISGLSSSEKTKIMVVDLSGNLAISPKLITNSTSSYSLDIDTLKPGNYMLRIESNGAVVTKQFVK
ncbi:hypothetical protein HMI54_012966, partial [Coelomomyces lativittatus]